MSRQIRRVPSRWKHLKYIAKGVNGKEIRLRPMLQKPFEEAYSEWQQSLREWYEGFELWHQEGKYKSYDGTIVPAEQVIKEEQAYRVKNGYDKWHQEETTLMLTGEYGYEEYNGPPPSPPSPNDYMPTGAWYQLFEEVSEGTPLTPPFKTKQQLLGWLIANKDFWAYQWSKEQAEAMVEQEWAPSGVVDNGKFYTAQESLLIPKAHD